MSSGVQFGTGEVCRIALQRLARPADRLKRPPEAEMVLVVPVVDRRVGRCQVLHREETCAVSSVEMVACDELAGDVVPAHDGVALPPLGDIRLDSPFGPRASPRRRRQALLTSLNSAV